MRGNDTVVADGVHRLTNGVSNSGRVGPQTMPSGLNTDSAQALRSLDNLTGIPADVLLAGHGEPWSGGLADAISRAKTAGTS